MTDEVSQDQVIWCGQDEPVLHGKTGKFIHDIDPDPRDIVAVIDSFIWFHILEYDSRYIPPEDHSDLRYQANLSGGNYDEALRKAEDASLADNLPNDLWTAVIKEDITKKSDQLLLKFPLVFSTIANVDFVTEEMAFRGRRKTNNKLVMAERSAREKTKHRVNL